MMGRSIRLLALLAGPLLAMLSVAGPLPGGAATPTDEWNFRVFLDDDEIGYHHFTLIGDEDRQQLITAAEFKVKFLFVTAYRYRHENEELWTGDCLQQISSRTDANGKQFLVEGQRADGHFAVVANATRNEVTGCVKTFAYWNPEILQEKALLNSQTGEILDVTVEPIATEILDVRGVPTEAIRYRLLARNMELDIWYSRDNRWLALESPVKGGRTLRYELT